jgi:iron complex transport system ATP-binding protein
MYRLRGVGMSYNGTPVLHDVTLEFEAPLFAAVVGPNGAGKSTLLGIMAGLRPGYAGQCLYRDREVRRWPRRAFAREVSFVPQTVRIEFPFTAEQVVLMGRTPYAGGLFESPEDWEAVERAMQLTDTVAFRHRDFRCACCFWTSPTAFLDLRHQIAIYGLLVELSRQGLLVIAATHDLNLAAAYADRIVALRGGRVVADAAPERVVDPAVIRQVFGVEARVAPGPRGRPWILYGE